MNIANLVTILRIVFSPVILLSLIYLQPGYSLLIFIFLAITDLADGIIARKRNEVTELGKIIDPAADKAIAFFALIGLFIKHEISILIVLILLMRDVFSIFLASFLVVTSKIKLKNKAKRKDSLLKGASKLGKSVTFLQFITICCLIAGFAYQNILVFAVLILSIAAIIDYTIKYRKLLPL